MGRQELTRELIRLAVSLPYGCQEMVFLLPGCRTGGFIGQFILLIIFKNTKFRNELRSSYLHTY